MRICSHVKSNKIFAPSQIKAAERCREEMQVIFNSTNWNAATTYDGIIAVFWGRLLELFRHFYILNISISNQLILVSYYAINLFQKNEVLIEVVIA